MDDKTKKIMDVKEVAAYLGFSESKIYKLLAKKGIPFKKIGGQYRFSKTVIDEWLTGKDDEFPGQERDLLKSQTEGLPRRLLLVALLNRELKKKGLKAIIVGGQAVEFYTAGGYATRDIDLVSAGYEELGDVLERWGFVRAGRHWVSEELDISVEVPGSHLDGDISKVTEVDINGVYAYIIGIEDIIIDRLKAFVHWQSEDDGQWAKELFALNREDIDQDYLLKRAGEEGVREALIKIGEEQA